MVIMDAEIDQKQFPLWHTYLQQTAESKQQRHPVQEYGTTRMCNTLLLSTT